MVSKTRKQAARDNAKEARGETAPQPPTERKSVHEKKVRPNMKGKMKIRLGHESADIYSGFEDQKGVQWVCPECKTPRRTVGHCYKCSKKQVATD